MPQLLSVAVVRTLNIVAAWIGLVGVAVGALLAFGGQYLMVRSERQERNTALLLEQCALIISLSEDYRNRVWEEQSKVASEVVAKWDIGTYRLAEARLRLLSRQPDFLASLDALDKSGRAVGAAWRLGVTDDSAFERALVAHRDALERFVSVSSQITQLRSAPSSR